MFNEYVIDNEGQSMKFAKSVSVLLYGLISYVTGVAGLASIILAMAGLIPLGEVLQLEQSVTVSFLINVGLIFLFGLQHSVMARASFKEKLYRIIPKSMERSTFVLASGVVAAIMVMAWQPVTGVIWQSSGYLNLALWAGFVFGWGYLLAATFAINHFDLFGLRQTWFEAMGKDYTNVAFKESWMYRYSRHPIMLGVLIGIWCVPTMTASMFMLSVGMTLYVVVGLYYEERDLIRQWGKNYLDYKKRVGALF